MGSIAREHLTWAATNGPPHHSCHIFVSKTIKCMSMKHERKTVKYICVAGAGLRLVAVTQQQDKAKRTLYAALSPRLETLSDDAAIAHVTSILQQLPWLGTAT